MTDFAADFHTWGIPSLTFLFFYLAAAVVLAVGTLIHRRTLLSGRTAPPADQLGPQQVAYLNGGKNLAVWTAIGALRGQGVIGVDRRHRLTADAPLPTGATPLDRAVHHAATQRCPARQVARTEWVVRALAELRDGLDRHGLLITPEQRVALRIGPLLMAVLSAVGIARIVAGVMNGRPVWYLVAVVLGLMVLCTLLFALVPRRTKAANAALRLLRMRNSHLAPHSNPSYATYGAAGTAMAVALYGSATIWALDPTFAQQAELQRQAAASTSGTAACGGSSTADASGGGCGGGGGGGCGG
ncbi:TIGR04222 domain-containing membrane protein [Micromonospora craniellae]|uniref:TIGR04222 domain-containing membrane protein n=1 Tax=Micromonospora craniellae TaxID=2294034 RepID=A0A372G3L0_9ACTN|nr:TIGR04222 domain-containing membrane protein [Micromonospora craniellae]QOC91225.1 TIGR04222 domain-containing membrane protein [Micromonospora craniellae]RFS47349.1 TIGR04222 domain-containing membrane protein [Micromonospora craniellae]